MTSSFHRFRDCAWLAWVLALALGCTGKISPDGQAASDHPSSARPGSGGFLPTAAEQPDDERPGASNPSKPSQVDPETADVNRVGIHRLNNTEYDNTVRDLLGVGETPAATF